MILLAPLQSFTDYHFRNAFSMHYTGIDGAVSPFISLLKGEKGKPRIARDVMPSNNRSIPVIPQILGNDAALFIQMAEFLHRWGYEKINWNLGCPVRSITRKQRGSGLIPYPDLIREMLEKIIPNIPQSLSVKIRLGLNNTDEIYQLVPVLNDFPLENIIVHARIGAQMYEGNVQHDVLQKCLPLFRHEVIYNGDIFSYSDCIAIKNRYPEIKKWMIGRGVFYNPFLPSMIKGEQAPTKEKAKEMFLSFLLDLYSEFQNDNHLLRVENKIKMLWELFSKGFVNSDSVFDQISHAPTMNDIVTITRKLVETEEMKNP